MESWRLHAKCVWPFSPSPKKNITGVSFFYPQPHRRHLPPNPHRFWSFNRAAFLRWGAGTRYANLLKRSRPLRHMRHKRDGLLRKISKQTRTHKGRKLGFAFNGFVYGDDVAAICVRMNDGSRVDVIVNWHTHNKKQANVPKGISPLWARKGCADGLYFADEVASSHSNTHECRMCAVYVVLSFTPHRMCIEVVRYVIFHYHSTRVVR